MEVPPGYFASLGNTLLPGQWEGTPNNIRLLYALTRNSWHTIIEILDEEPEVINRQIGNGKDTLLVIAVKNNADDQSIKDLIDRTPPEKLAYSNEETGRFEKNMSAIHWAVVNKNFVAAKLLVSKRAAMLNSLDYHKRTPIEIALYAENMEMAYYLLKLASIYGQHEECHPTDEAYRNIFEHAVDHRLYDFASVFVQQYPRLASDTFLWKRLIEKCEDFPSRSRLNMLQSIMYSWTPMHSTTVSKRSSSELRMENILSLSSTNTDIQSSSPHISRGFTQLQKRAQRVFSMLVLPAIKNIRLLKLKHRQALELVKTLCMQIHTLGGPNCRNDVRRVFNSAVQNGIPDIVEVILEVFPQAIRYTDDDGINALQFAASHRDGKTFHLLHKRCTLENEDLPLSIDTYGNNILHLVAKRARRNRVGTGSGEVLQLQREFRWYKEMENLLNSDLKFRKNLDKKVPLEVFDEEHHDMLKSEGEWMTSMSNSCMVAGSLIAAVVFAAAITLPGGNQDNGPPSFSSRLSFKIFAFSDAFALISSLTVVVTFLSIFTTRYSVESFQYDLPNKLIIGLISLLLSVSFLMSAFCATVHLLLTEGYKWIIYPTVPVSFIPVFFFAYLQLPSLVNIARSTYGRNIFKENNAALAGSN